VFLWNGNVELKSGLRVDSPPSSSWLPYTIESEQPWQGTHDRHTHLQQYTQKHTHTRDHRSVNNIITQSVMQQYYQKQQDSLTEEISFCLQVGPAANFIFLNIFQPFDSRHIRRTINQPNINCSQRNVIQGTLL